jgi:cell division protein FtsA
MPVRLGFPVGIKGIVQLVHGPQYATGVGLVRYGSQQLADALGRGEAAPTKSQPVEQAEAIIRKSGFWSWLRAAF